MGATTRAGIPYPDPTTANNFSLHMSQLAQSVDDEFAMMRQGLLSSRPATPEQRSLYWATNDRGGKLFYGDGSSHFEIGPSAVAGPVSGYTGLITAAPSALVSDAVLGIRGKASQSGDLLRLQNSTPTTIARVDSSGSFHGSTGTAVFVDQLIDLQGPKHRIDMRSGFGSLVSEVGQSGWQVFGGNTAVPALLVNTNPSQSGSLQEWQVNGATKALITAAGDLSLLSSSPSVWRNLISFQNGSGTTQWQLVSDTSGAGATDFGLWNSPAGAYAWTTTAAQEMSVNNKLTVAGGARQSTAAVLDVQGDIGMRETDSLRVVSGAAQGRVVFQDTSNLYMGAIDQPRNLSLRAQGFDILLLSSGGYSTTAKASVGTSTINSDARMRVQTGSSPVNESGLYVYNSPSAGWHTLHLQSAFTSGFGAELLYAENASGVMGSLTGTGNWNARAGYFGAGAFGSGAGYTYIGDNGGVQSLIAAQGSAADVDMLINPKGAGRVSIGVGSLHYVSNVGEPAFQNSWSDLGGMFGNVRFWKDPFGIVHLHGVAKAGTIGATAFTLPVGYRPLFGADTSFPTSMNGVMSQVEIYSNGNVAIGTSGSPPAGAYATLDGISFPTFA